MTDGTLFTGKTVEDAVADGLRGLGLTQEQAEIEIVSRGSRGLFGIGSEPAQVRITPRTSKSPAQGASQPPSQPPERATPADQPALAVQQTPAAEPPPVSQPAPIAALPPQTPTVVAKDEPAASAKSPMQEPAGDEEPVEEREEHGSSLNDGPADEADEAEMAALAVELLTETVRLMGFEADVVASWQEPDADNDERYLLLNLHGRDLGALIGRRGETLGNLQYLLRLMVNQRLHQWKNIVVDVEQYRQHRAEHLMQLAQRSAEQVARSGRPLSLEPMPPNERRIIHLALRDNTSVYTESSGEGERRKIQILPRRSS